MITKDECCKAVKNFRAKQGVEASDENIIATVHLMNTHGLDLHSAMDQSSRSGNDHGIDAWFYDEKANDLSVYQSKLTESRAAALRGLGDLDYARQWLEEVLIDGAVTAIPDNHCLFNLYTALAQRKESIRKVNFLLLSPLQAYSEHPFVKKTGGGMMTVREFLDEVRKLVLQFSLGELPGFRELHRETQGRGETVALDPVTQYYLLHRAYFGLHARAGWGVHPLRQRVREGRNGIESGLEHPRTGRQVRAGKEGPSAQGCRRWRSRRERRRKAAAASIGCWTGRSASRAMTWARAGADCRRRWWTSCTG